MKLTFNSVVIGDDAAAPRRTIVVNAIGGECAVQQEPLAGGANPFLKARGNVAGSLAVTVTNVFGTVDLANAFILTEYGRIGVQGSLVWARAATIFTCVAAVLQSVSCQLLGVTVLVQYNFKVTTIA